MKVEEDLEECLEEKGGEAALALEEEVFESRAHTAASIRLTSPLGVQKSDALRGRGCEITATGKNGGVTSASP